MLLCVALAACVSAQVPSERQLVAQPVISPMFPPAVQYWREDIARWSRQHDVPANVFATIMYLESCGDPHIAPDEDKRHDINVYARGLYQVVPDFWLKEYAPDDTYDPEINALGAARAIKFCASFERNETLYDRKAFACYNGGHGAHWYDIEDWLVQPTVYSQWAIGIYEDAENGTDKMYSEVHTNHKHQVCARSERKLEI